MAYPTPVNNDSNFHTAIRSVNSSASITYYHSFDKMTGYPIMICYKICCISHFLILILNHLRGNVFHLQSWQKFVNFFRVSQSHTIEGKLFIDQFAFKKKQYYVVSSLISFEPCLKSSKNIIGCMVD